MKSKIIYFSQVFIIQTGPCMGEYDFRSESLIATAGASLARLARTAYEKGLSGLELAASIPGIIGGAVVMNVGSGGGDISWVVKRVRTFKPGAGMKEKYGIDLGLEIEIWQVSPDTCDRR
ncbi:MAG: FAD-binding protein [Candidatus Auribacterota bacterium]|nr:FAD-binding protein [Candidatus Auribacterota bacterium]